MKPATKSRRKTTTDAVEILHRRFVGNDARRSAELEEERRKFAIGRQLYEARMNSGLSLRELAKRARTSPAAILRMEDADYDRYSLPTLARIAAALDCHVVVSIAPNQAA